MSSAWCNTADSRTLILNSPPPHDDILREKLEKSKPDERITITDSSTRDVEALYSLFDYPDNSYLPPFSCSKSSTHEAILNLYDLAVDKKCDAACEVIVAFVDQEMLNAKLEPFLVFAERVHMIKAKETKPKRRPESLLGQMIKAQLAFFLPEVTSDGMAKVTQKAGSVLSKLLLDVMAENGVRRVWRKRARRTVE